MYASHDSMSPNLMRTTRGLVKRNNIRLVSQFRPQLLRASHILPSSNNQIEALKEPCPIASDLFQTLGDFVIRRKLILSSLPPGEFYS